MKQKYKIEFPGSKKEWTDDYELLTSYAKALMKDSPALYSKATLLVKAGKYEEKHNLNEYITTPVMFRVDKAGGFKGQVTAMFPYEIELNYNVGAYVHVGQHHNVDYDTVIQQTRPATPEEYKDLKAELESIGYILKVINRRNYNTFLAAYHVMKKTMFFGPDRTKW